MIPIGPLMWEHRLIERLIEQMNAERQRMQSLNRANPLFIEAVVDFIRTYADRCHHGKEEDILFRDLRKKELNSEHRRIMDELIEEHRKGRALVRSLVDAKDRYVLDDESALVGIQHCFAQLADFYPKHIEKEDKHFFYPCMDYFDKSEKEVMLQEFWEFDKQLIHEKYRQVVDRLETL